MKKKTHKPLLVQSQTPGLEILLYDNARCLYMSLKRKKSTHSQFLGLLLVNIFVLTMRNKTSSDLFYPSSLLKAKHRNLDLQIYTVSACEDLLTDK